MPENMGFLAPKKKNPFQENDRYLDKENGYYTGSGKINSTK